MSWHFTEEKIARQLKELSQAVVRNKFAVPGFRLERAGKEPSTLTTENSYETQSEAALLKAEIVIPAGWAGQKVYLALKISGSESLVYVDGVPAQAIDRFHHDLLLTDCAVEGKTFAITIEAFTGSVVTVNKSHFLGQPATHADNVVVQIQTAEVQWIDRTAEDLYFDISASLGALKTFDKSSRYYTVLLNVLNETVNLIDLRYGAGDDRFYQSAEVARRHFKAEFLDKYKADPEFTPVFMAVGHAHIDTAWLWPLAHTRRKIGRTFSTQATLADRYRDVGYIFTCSQPQQYEFLKEDYPDVFARVKSAIDAGAWETVGGMWVEADCNIASGEALVRQFLYGQRFFEKEFGNKGRNDVVWLPDVFGYTASFPQIIKKAGMKYFMTIKIYWSQINKPPYQTFEWEGIDGTTVLTHFAPGGDYNASMQPEQVAKFWDAYNQKNINDTALYIFGYGDGGGGPTRMMLENARRLESFPNMPRVKASSAQNFFETLEKQVAGAPNLPRWVGELYLELHRGTYTGQARNKRWNRQSEIGLQVAEQASSLALIRSGAAYPHEALDQHWKLTLLNQFHDIIPGSSIRPVYEDSDKHYAQILSAARELTASALASVAATVRASAGDVVVYNPLSWKRADAAVLPRSLGAPGQDAVGLEGEELTLVDSAKPASLGYCVAGSGSQPASRASELSASPHRLENRFFRIDLDGCAQIESLFDKVNDREALDTTSPFKGNALLSFEDRSMNWDAWDVDIYYQDKMYPITDVSSVKAIESGPVRATVEIVRNFGRGSVITQRVSVWRDLPRIDFDTLVDWHERNTLLKAAFPVDVHSPRATYDIQFGNVERPTHWNTSWDWARFEVCAHKWADLSEGGENGYGVSLLSDSKYGWDIKGNTLRLTLLRSPVDPDPEADQGKQRFTYSLYPHAGDWRTAQTVRRAYELNVPYQAVPASGSGNGPDRFSLIETEQPNLIIETVKKAEDRNALIVRCYEAYGQRGKGVFTFGLPVKSAKEVNLMEVETEETREARVDVAGANVSFDYKPYEIKTFEVILASK